MYSILKTKQKPLLNPQLNSPLWKALGSILKEIGGEGRDTKHLRAADTIKIHRTSTFKTNPMLMVM